MTQKTSFHQLMAQTVKSNGLKHVGKTLVDAGLISPAELKVARALKQRYYSPQKRRFATLTAHSNKQIDVIYLEPTHSRNWAVRPTNELLISNGRLRLGTMVVPQELINEAKIYHKTHHARWVDTIFRDGKGSYARQRPCSSLLATPKTAQNFQPI